MFGSVFSVHALTASKHRDAVEPRFATLSDERVRSELMTGIAPTPSKKSATSV